MGTILAWLFIIAAGLLIGVLVYDINRKIQKTEKAVEEIIHFSGQRIRKIETLHVLLLVQVLEMGFGLSEGELERLLGINFDQIQGWKENGPPADLLQKLAYYADFLQKLEGYLQPGLLPQVIRRPSQKLGGKTLFDLIMEGREQEVLEYFENLLSYASTE